MDDPALVLLGLGALAALALGMGHFTHWAIARWRWHRVTKGMATEFNTVQRQVQDAIFKGIADHPQLSLRQAAKAFDDGIAAINFPDERNRK